MRDLIIVDVIAAFLRSAPKIGFGKYAAKLLEQE